MYGGIINTRTGAREHQYIVDNIGRRVFTALCGTWKIQDFSSSPTEYGWKTIGPVDLICGLSHIVATVISTTVPYAFSSSRMVEGWIEIKYSHRIHKGPKD